MLKNKTLPKQFLDKVIFQYKKYLVGMTGFEPATSWSQTRRATSCATSRNVYIIYIFSKIYSSGKCTFYYFFSYFYAKTASASISPPFLIFSSNALKIFIFTDFFNSKLISDCNLQ